MKKRIRQQELRAISDKLQGPLVSAIGALSRVKSETLDPPVQDCLGHVRAMVENAYIFCFGTLASFAQEAGEEFFFMDDKIDARAELRRLCNILQVISERDDNVTIAYEVEDDFPPSLSMNKDVFISVLYCLLHNALTYADSDSKIVLTFSSKRSTKIKVCSTGEPIHPGDRRVIFRKFKRGRVFEKTNRHSHGLGLGLWVARRLMRAVGGDLTVELSPNNKRLSVFTVHMPKPEKTG